MMYFTEALSALLLISGRLTTVLADSPQVVDLGYALYQGNFNSTSNITDFFGIRFSAPPISESSVFRSDNT